MDPISMLLQGFEALTCSKIPEFYGIVKAAAGKGATIGTECNAPDLRAMTQQSIKAPTCAGIPEFYC
jgi:hypothetical protein